MSLRSMIAVLAVMVSVSLSWAADEKPPMVPLGDGKIQFTPPPSETWEPSQHNKPDILVYTAKKHDAIVAIQLVPDEMVIDQATTAALVKHLKGSHGNAKVLLQPTVVADERFALKIHERYEAGKAEKKQVADVLHLYRYVGRRLVEATVNSVADEAETVKAEHGDAEEALLSATGPGAKPRKPASKPAMKP